MSLMSGISDTSMVREKSDAAKILKYVKMLPTEDDLPYDDGEPMETTRHRDQMILLIQSLQAFWKDSRRYYASGNMFLHFDLMNRKTFRGPDFFLVLDVDNSERKSWVVWQEGKFPDVIVELLSDTTRKIDKTEKKVLYEQVFKTEEYYIYDPFSYEFTGYRLQGKHYKTVFPDNESRIYSPLTGLYLAVKENWLRWMTTEGYVLPSHEELFKEAEYRAEQENFRAEQEKHRAEQETFRAEQEKHRAEQETFRAEQEKLRAEHAEEQLLETARKMFIKGYKLNEISELTGLPVDIIHSNIK